MTRWQKDVQGCLCCHLRVLSGVLLRRRYNAIATVSILAMVLTSAAGLDLPVATHGFEEWAGVVAKAMSFGGRNKDQSLQALKTFQAKATAKMQKQVSPQSRPMGIPN